MMYKPEHFSLDELVCQDVYDKFGDVAWQFFDIKLLITLDTIRNLLNKPIWINNWQVHGNYDERGFRCIQCSLVQQALKDKRLYVSPHMTGQGADCDIEGMSAKEVRQWLEANKNKLPYPIRLEMDVDWVHIDTRDTGLGKISYFKK